MTQEPGEKVTVSQARTPTDWNSIDWKSAVEYVRKLRQEIFRATKEGDLKKVRTLQRIMLRSYENRVLSVRRVTQTNKGKNIQLVHLFCHQAEHGSKKRAKETE